MSFHIDDERMSLRDLAERMEGTDLIPSQLPLLEDLRGKIATLGGTGIATLADLRRALNKRAALSALAHRCGIAETYLIILRRAVEGWFPKPPPLAAYPGADPAAIEALADEGTEDARSLFDAASKRSDRRALAKRAGLKPGVLDELAALSDLSRIQWVAPSFARLLYDAGYKNADDVAKADPEKMHSVIVALNADERYYRGAIGKRDMARLIRAARAIPIHFEP